MIAPATQQSGTGGSETEGELTALEATTISGYEATAVEGFPSDTVRVALEDEGLEAGPRRLRHQRGPEPRARSSTSRGPWAPRAPPCERGCRRWP